MSVLNLASPKNGNFIANGLAVSVFGNTTFELPYVGVPLQTGDAIVVRFPVDTANQVQLRVTGGTLKELRNLSGGNTQGIKAGVPIILINSGLYWIVQGLSVSSSICDFEYDSAGDEIVPLSTNTWYNTTSQYVFRGTTTALTRDTFIEYLDRTYNAKQAGETMKIDVSIVGGTANNTNAKGSALIHQLRTVRSVESTIQRIPTSHNENTQDSGSRIKGYRMGVNFSKVYANLAANEPIRVILGGFGGWASNATANIPQNFYITHYTIMISHFYK